MWGGRFSNSTDNFVQGFTSSVQFDQRLYAHDIEGSIQHARMLSHIGVLTAEERDEIVDGLRQVKAEIESSQFSWSVELEDVHMNVEARLIELIGDTGRKLHTGRSRNDQVATDMRLWLSDQVNQILIQIDQCEKSIVDLAQAHIRTIMPGFTHLQSAQPISFAHHLLAWFEMMERDRERLSQLQDRIKVLPLGSAALAGTSYPIDREYVRAQLGFTHVSRNSLDAVSDRDFVIEFISVSSLLMVHLSRWCEEIIFWNSSPVALVTLPDELCTGSSIMPQKKNPDVPELVRGKTGRVIGNLNSLLMLMKAQPLAYNKDNQEDKEPLFDTVDTVTDCLTAMTSLIGGLEPNTERMYQLASAGYPTATDLADWLVRRDIPFREAHEIVGKVVSYAEKKGCELVELSLEEFLQFSSIFDETIYDVLSVEASINARSHIGGTASSTVETEIARIRKVLTTRGNS